MSVANMHELAWHAGHDVKVVTYGDPMVNAAVECESCGTVLVDFDRTREPVRRVFVDRGKYDTWAESVQSVMDTNAGFEDSAWTYLTEALKHGTYDDSEHGGVTSLYLCEDKAELRRQLEEWRERFLAADRAEGAVDREWSWTDFALPAE